MGYLTADRLLVGRRRRVLAWLTVAVAFASLVPPGSTARPAGSDLVVAYLSDPPASVVAGRSFVARDRTKNAGERRTRSSVTAYWLSRRARKRRDVTQVASRRVRALAPGRGNRGRVRITVPRALMPGRYRLVACAGVTRHVRKIPRRSSCRASKRPILVASPAATPPGSAAPKLGAVSVFARVPTPGHPFGVLADNRHVFVVTSAGNPLHVNADSERLLIYTLDGRLLNTTTVSVPASNMGLFGLALDSQGRLYVGDMNGRILRYRIQDDRPLQPSIYAQTPLVGGWQTSMWNGLVFDQRGNLYVGDANGSIWRIPPNGQPALWFSQSDAPLSGPFGLALGPDGKLYFDTVPANRVNELVVYRLPVVDHPTSADLQEVHSFAQQCCSPSVPAGLAFGRSGRLYLDGFTFGGIAVLGPDGREQSRITSPLFDAPDGIAFLGNSFLAANTDFSPLEDPSRWTVTKVDAGEPGLPLVRPPIP